MKLHIVLLLLLPACGFSQDWKVLSHVDYSLKYPANWELSDKEEMGVKFFLFSELESPEDAFRENINLVTEDLTGYNLSLDEYTKLTVEQLTKMLPGSKMLENKTLTTGPRPHRALTYTATQSHLDLKFLVYIWIVKDKAYVLTFSALETSFDKFKLRAAEIMETFVIKK